MTDETKKLMLDAAIALDDAIARIYPEEFSEAVVRAVVQRFFDAGGVINRLATLADALREAAK